MSRRDLNDTELYNALNVEPIPAVNETVKKQAVESAMSAFDVEFKKKSQGSDANVRPISITAYIFQLIGDWIMNISYRQMATVGALATAVLVVALVPQVQEQIPGMGEEGFAPINRPQEVQSQEVGPITAKKEAKGKAKISAEVGLAAELSPTMMAEPEPATISNKIARKVLSVPSQPYMSSPTQQGTAYSYMPEAALDMSDGGGGSYSAGSAPVAAYAPPAPSMNLKMAQMARQKQQHYRKSKMLGVMQTPGDVQHKVSAQDLVLFEQEGEERDRFAKADMNPVHLTSDQPVSTLSVDVDTASYSFVRRQINAGRLPQPNAVRVEEMINYFDYDYVTPTDVAKPFQPTVALYPTPWNSKTRLLHIGIKGYAATKLAKKSNLVFLVDVSGSMSAQDKLPLLKNALKLLVDSLNPDDTVAIVVYAGAAGTVLEPTSVKERHKIIAALDKLSAGGSTAGGAGINLAYSLAEGNFDKSAVNRVILATDGDFNVGITDKGALKGLIERKRKNGVFLSILGFGQGNYNDRLMQELAQNGNGIAAYIDNLNEARKFLVEEAVANLFPIARDVKIQVEFNPKRVAEYRLIGYETRLLKREDFKNDAVDAGDIGAGHTVTAIYEVALAGSAGQLIEPLRYGKKTVEIKKPVDNSGEFAFLKMRYKLPEETKSLLISRAIGDADMVSVIDNLSDDMRFGAAVAAFGQKLRGGRYTGEFAHKDIIDLANSGKGADQFGYRAEFVSMVRLADSLK